MLIKATRESICIGAYYHAKENHEHIVTIDQCYREDGKYIVTFCSQGGGMVLKLPLDQFRLQYELMNMEENAQFTDLRPRYAYFDSDHKQGPGETTRLWPCLMSNQRWNGWAEPWFDKTTIEMLFDVYVKDNMCSPIYWESETKGVFFEQNDGEWWQLSHRRYHNEDYFAVEGYCWSEYRDQDKLFIIATPVYPFTAKEETDENLVTEFITWFNTVATSMADANKYTREEFEPLLVHDWSKDPDTFGFSAYDAVYLRSWWYRWKRCTDA